MTANKFRGLEARRECRRKWGIFASLGCGAACGRNVAGPMPTPTGKRRTKQAPSTLGAVIEASRSLLLRLTSPHEESRAQARATSIAISMQCGCSVHGRQVESCSAARPTADRPTHSHETNFAAVLLTCHGRRLNSSSFCERSTATCARRASSDVVRNTLTGPCPAARPCWPASSHAPCRSDVT